MEQGRGQRVLRASHPPSVRSADERREAIEAIRAELGADKVSTMRSKARQGEVAARLNPDRAASQHTLARRRDKRLIDTGGSSSSSARWERHWRHGSRRQTSDTLSGLFSLRRGESHSLSTYTLDSHAVSWTVSRSEASSCSDQSCRCRRPLILGALRWLTVCSKAVSMALARPSTSMRQLAWACHLERLRGRRCVPPSHLPTRHADLVHSRLS